MIDAYKHGKDLYASIASTVYHNNYEDNLEKYADGTGNVDGAKRRSSVKDLLLGKPHRFDLDIKENHSAPL